MAEQKTLGKAMKIRVLTPSDDIVAITDMLHRAYSSLGARGLNYTATYQSPEVTAERLFSGYPIGAECDGRIIGTLTVYPPDPHSSVAVYRDARTYSFGQFGVDPAFKGQGIGRALHRAAIDYALSQGAGFLVLDTAAPAQELVATYTRWGYTVVERTTWAGKHYESVLMRCSILKPPNQPVQHNAGSRSFSVDSPASESPSLLGPRG